MTTVCSSGHTHPVGLTCRQCRILLLSRLARKKVPGPTKVFRRRDREPRQKVKADLRRER